MVMMAEPLIKTLSAINHLRQKAPVILLSPTGQPFDQKRAASLAASTGAVFVCGRYEGVDQRFVDQYVDEQWSLASGNHANIARWRREQSLMITAKVRPDLISAARARGDLTPEDEAFLRTLG